MAKLIKTPFVELNRHLNGGFSPRNTVILTGESFANNDLMALNIVHHITRSQRQPVVWCVRGRERGRGDYGTRIDNYRALLHAMDSRRESSLSSAKPGKIFFCRMPSPCEAKVVNKKVMGKAVEAIRSPGPGRSPEECVVTVVISDDTPSPFDEGSGLGYEQLKAYAQERNFFALLVSGSAKRTGSKSSLAHEALPLLADNEYVLNLVPEPRSSEHKLEVFRKGRRVFGVFRSDFLCTLDENSKTFLAGGALDNAGKLVPRNSLRKVTF